MGSSHHYRVACCYRGNDAAAWREGILRYDHDRLDHFGSGGFSMRPEHQWDRPRLELGVARALDEGCPSLRAQGIPTAVTCRYGEESFELAMGRHDYTALRSWLESVPPGWNSNVA